MRRCAAALSPSGSTFPASPCAFAFSDPVRAFRSPLTIASYACSATRAGSSFLMVPIRVASSMPARSKNSVSVGPGRKDVTVTPVSLTSSASAWAKDSTNAVEALYTGWKEPAAAAPGVALEAGPADELRVRGGRREGRVGHAGVLDVVGQRLGEGLPERLGGVVHGLEGTGRRRGDGRGEGEPALAAGHHGPE